VKRVVLLTLLHEKGKVRLRVVAALLTFVPHERGKGRGGKKAHYLLFFH